MQEAMRAKAILLNEEGGFAEDEVEDGAEAEVGDDDEEEDVEETASWEN